MQFHALGLLDPRKKEYMSKQEVFVLIQAMGGDGGWEDQLDKTRSSTFRRQVFLSFRSFSFFGKREKYRFSPAYLLKDGLSFLE